MEGKLCVARKSRVGRFGEVRKGGLSTSGRVAVSPRTMNNTSCGCSIVIPVGYDRAELRVFCCEQLIHGSIALSS